MTLKPAALALPLLLAVLAQGCNKPTAAQQDQTSSQESNGGKVPPASTAPSPSTGS